MGRQTAESDNTQNTAADSIGNFKWVSSIPFKLCAMFYLNSECQLLVASSNSTSNVQPPTCIEVYSYLPGEGFKGSPTRRCDFRTAFYYQHMLLCHKLLLYFPKTNCPDEERELHVRNTRQELAELPICMSAFDLNFACWVESREALITPVDSGAATAAATIANEGDKTDILCCSEAFYINRLEKDGDKYELRKLRISHLESNY